MNTNTSNNTVIIQHNEDTNEKQQGTDICEQFESIIESLHLFRSQINGLQQQIRVLEKNVKKQMKTLKKESTKSKNKGNRKPSGFAKPSKKSYSFFTVATGIGIIIAIVVVVWYLSRG
jgi:flagellar motility protein MotE (MotC chaperone)